MKNEKRLLWRVFTMNDHDNGNRNYRFDYDDIGKVSSFEEARAIIIARLNHLKEDLAYVPDIEERLFKEIEKAHDDRKLSLMDIYAGFYAPCQITDTVFEPKGTGDMNDVMIDFSTGFDEFIEAMEEQYVECIIKRRRAAVLLKRMLSLGLPFSKILYLYYYKKLEPNEIIKINFISRATFYRLKSFAINMLTSMYYPGKSDDKNHGKGGEPAK